MRAEDRGSDGGPPVGVAMFWFALSAAVAAPLDLMFVSADANATLNVSWGLSPVAWGGVQGLGMTGKGTPALQITGDPGGRNVTQVVALTNSVGSVDLGGANWPRGVAVSFVVVDGSGMFDAVTLQGGGGPTVRVNALGGVEPTPAPVARAAPSPTPRPSPAPAATRTQTTTRSSDGTSTTTTTRSDSGTTTRTTTARTSVDIGAIDPNAVLGTMAQVAATVQTMSQAGQEDPTASPEPAVPAYQGPSAQQIALDPNDPRTQACTPIVPAGDVPRCIARASARPLGLAEAGQCARLSSAGLRAECWEFVVEATVSVDGMLGACADVLGTDVWAMRCVKAVVEAETPPADDIRACGALFPANEDRMQCVRRFQALVWSPHEVVPGCQQHFGADAVACMHAIAGGVEQPIPGLIPACAETFGPLESRTACLELHRRNTKGDPAGAVRACGSLFEDPKERLTCVDRVRDDPSPSRIEACAGQPAGKARLKCAGGS